jgi:hypothetical protein
VTDEEGEVWLERVNAIAVDDGVIAIATDLRSGRRGPLSPGS